MSLKSEYDKKFKFRFYDSHIDSFDPENLVDFDFKYAQIKSKQETELKSHEKYRKFVIEINPKVSKILVYCNFGYVAKRISQNHIGIFKYDEALENIKKKKEKDKIKLIHGKIDGKRVYRDDGTLNKSSGTGHQVISDSQVNIETDEDRGDSSIEQKDENPIENTQDILKEEIIEGIEDVDEDVYEEADEDDIEAVKELQQMIGSYDLEDEDLPIIKEKEEEEQKEEEEKEEEEQKEEEQKEEEQKEEEQKEEEQKEEEQKEEDLQEEQPIDLTDFICCVSCGKELRKSNFTYCGYCGAKIEIIRKCNKCGTIIKELGFHFCTSCGEKLN